MSIKYYRLAKDEEPPEEFCAVRDVGGEPSEYVFYVPEGEVAKLRELCHDLRKEYAYLRARPRRFYVQHEARMAAIDTRMRELGIESGN